jgi:hypothetical protein
VKCNKCGRPLHDCPACNGGRLSGELSKCSKCNGSHLVCPENEGYWK